MGTFGKPAIEWHPLPFMQELLDDMTADLASPKYVRTVRTALAHFALFCRDEEIFHPEEISRETLLRYRGYIAKKGWSPRYQYLLFRLLRSWLKWLKENEYIKDDPWVDIKLGRVPKKKKGISEESLGLLFETHRRQAFHLSPFNFHRREVILALLYGWGLHSGELLSLNVVSVDFSLDVVTAHNRRRGAKSLPYPDSMKTVIKRYLQVRVKYAKVEEDALLIDIQGDRLSNANLYRIITELGDRAGVKVTPQLLRDACGAQLLEHMPVAHVGEILGIADLRNVKEYTRVSPEVAAAHEAAIVALRRLSHPS